MVEIITKGEHEKINFDVFVVPWKPHSNTLTKMYQVNGVFANVMKYLISKMNKCSDNHAYTTTSENPRYIPYTLEIPHIHESPSLKHVRTLMDLCDYIGFQFLILPLEWKEVLK
jgi:hypothetical protein